MNCLFLLSAKVLIYFYFSKHFLSFFVVKKVKKGEDV